LPKLFLVGVGTGFVSAGKIDTCSLEGSESAAVNSDMLSAGSRGGLMKIGYGPKRYKGDCRVTTFFVLVAIIAVAAALAVFYLWWLKQKKPEENVTVTSEWQPTGKIDFHCAELPKTTSYQQFLS